MQGEKQVFQAFTPFGS